ncbi:MAG: CHAP domain-containing protein [Alphaproteobacteria bacterium]|nr:CHAP domain-containing protein [Alphaproteobacteria bacterium]
MGTTLMLRVMRRAMALCTVLALGGCALFDDSDPGPMTRHAAGAYPRIVSTGRPQQCVPYARAHSGVGIWGDAWTWWDKAAGRFGRSHRPRPGSVMVLVGYGGSESGHVAVVRRVLNGREIVVDHANWLNHGEVSLDSPVLDVSDDNDWSEVRVWYTPRHHFGGRIYHVEGFILPSRLEDRVASR